MSSEKSKYDVLYMAIFAGLFIYAVQNLKGLFSGPSKAENVGEEVLRVERLVNELSDAGKIDTRYKASARNYGNQIILFYNKQGIFPSDKIIKEEIVNKFGVFNTSPGWSGAGGSW
jgi:hypothetical protein